MMEVKEQKKKEKKNTEKHLCITSKHRSKDVKTEIKENSIKASEKFYNYLRKSEESEGKNRNYRLFSGEKKGTKIKDTKRKPDE